MWRKRASLPVPCAYGVMTKASVSGAAAAMESAMTGRLLVPSNNF